MRTWPRGTRAPRPQRLPRNHAATPTPSGHHPQPAAIHTRLQREHHPPLPIVNRGIPRLLPQENPTPALGSIPASARGMTVTASPAAPASTQATRASTQDGSSPAAANQPAAAAPGAPDPSATTAREAAGHGENAGELSGGATTAPVGGARELPSAGSSTMVEDDGSAGDGSGGGSDGIKALPAPNEGGDAQTLEVDGRPISLDHLGPTVVNKDGTLSRITNWAEMTDIERQNTLRILVKRNQIRLGTLRQGARGENT